MKRFFCLAFACVLMIITAVPTAFAAAVDVNFIHTGDMSGTIFKDEAKGTVGYGNVLSVKTGIPDAILIDSGNFLCDTSLNSSGLNGKIVSAMNEAGYDFATLGVNDVRYSKAQLDEILAPAEFKIISSNIISASAEKETYIYDQTLVKTLNGVKTGFFAVTDAADTADFKFKDPLEASKEFASKLRSGGSKIIVAVINTKNPSLAKEIAEQNPNITIIIEGGTGNFSAGGTPIGRTLAVNTGLAGNAVGVTSVKVNGGQLMSFQTSNYNLKNINDTYPETNDLEKKMKKAQEEIDSFNSEAVGRLNMPLSYNEQDLKTKSTPLGNFLAEALRDCAKADFAVIKGSDIKGGLSVEITGNELYSLFDRNDTVEVRKITGANFLKAMEMCVNKIVKNETGEIDYEKSVSDNFLQISGFSFEYNPDYPIGKRIIRLVSDNGTVIKSDSKLYTVAGESEFFNTYNEYFSSAEKVETLTTVIDAVKEYITGKDEIEIYEAERIKPTNEKKSYMWVVWICIGSFLAAVLIAYLAAKIIMIINNR